MFARLGLYFYKERYIISKWKSILSSGNKNKLPSRLHNKSAKYDSLVLCFYLLSIYKIKIFKRSVSEVLCSETLELIYFAVHLRVFFSSQYHFTESCSARLAYLPLWVLLCLYHSYGELWCGGGVTLLVSIWLLVYAVS